MRETIRYREHEIGERHLDTLIGLAKGVAADGVITTAEAEVLLTWLVQSTATMEHPITQNLLHIVSGVLEDGVVDEDESKELISVLDKLTGGRTELGELAKATTLPLDDPAPVIDFNVPCSCSRERSPLAHVKSVRRPLNTWVQ